MRIALAQLSKTENGYVIKYPEAVQVEQNVPSSLSMMDDVQLEVMAEMHVLARDDDGGWNDEDAREARLEKTRERLRAMRERLQARTQKVWIIKVCEWHFPSLAGVMQALQSADRAHEQLMGLLRAGTTFVGPLQPMALIPPGAPGF